MHYSTIVRRLAVPIASILVVSCQAGGPIGTSGQATGTGASATTPSKQVPGKSAQQAVLDKAVSSVPAPNDAECVRSKLKERLTDEDFLQADAANAINSPYPVRPATGIHDVLQECVKDPYYKAPSPAPSPRP